MYWSGNGNGHTNNDHFMYWSGNGNGHTKYMTILCTDPATATVTLNIWPFYVLIRQRQRSH